MKISLKTDIKNNTSNMTSGKRTLRKRILFLSALMIFGVFVGYMLSILSSKDASGNLFVNKTNYKSADHITVNFQNPEFKFINPYVPSPISIEASFPELNDLRNLVENYCKSALKDKSLNQISVYFRDMTNGAWFGINENEKFIPASLTKVPILIIAFQKAEKEPDYLQKRLIYKGSPSAKYLEEHPELDHIRTVMKVNESYSIEDLISFMITKSDNEAAMMILNDLGVNQLKVLQAQLGNKVPVDAPSEINILSTKNFSSFFRLLYNSSLLSREYSEKALEMLSHAEYDKGIRQAVPANIQVCHKYGERDTFLSPTVLQIQQLHHAGLIYYPRKPYFICVMTKGSKKKQMEKAIFEISKIVYEQIDNQVRLCQRTNLIHDIN